MSVIGLTIDEGKRVFFVIYLKALVHCWKSSSFYLTPNNIFVGIEFKPDYIWDQSTKLETLHLVQLYK